MATTAAELRAVAGAAAVAVAAFGAAWSCAPAADPELPAPQPTTQPAPPPTPTAAETPGPGPSEEPPRASAAPEIRLGLVVGAPAATLGGGAAMAVTDPAGSYVAALAAGETRRVVADGSGLHLSGPAGVAAGSSEALTLIATDPGGSVRVNGREYRGTVALLRDRTGLTVVNRVDLESYVLGVVSAEMGRRSLAEREALRAQAVVSRTYALRNLRRWNAQGFDLYATVADQVYGGVEAETPEARDAALATRGMVLTYGGAPIDAFFYSTCGGTTAEGTEVFRNANRPYLRSFADVAPDGTAYCSISPRFRWREEWTGSALRGTLRRTLPASAGVPSTGVGVVRDVWIARRTGSGRVGQLAIALAGNEVRVDGPAVRQVLQPVSGGLLRSSAFSLIAERAGRRVTRLVAEGGGAGHGVGFCQWGAVGRSRAGQDFRRILAAYYPGAELERLY